MPILKGALGLFACVSGAFALLESKASKGTDCENPDFLLILGCRVRGEKAEPTLEMRINSAAEFLKKNKDTIAICCGGIVHDDQYKSEAEVIFEGLAARGIEKERIILEDKSRTTRENFINAKKIIDGYDGEKRSVAFLSSEFHLLRAGVLAKQCGFNAESVAAESPKKEKLKNYIREFIVFPMVYLEKR